jgi:hypothetical protein
MKPESIDDMQILPIYLQPVVQCKACENLISYESFIKPFSDEFLSQEDHVDKHSIFEVMYNYSIEELSKSPTMVGISCIVCQKYLGLKYVILLPPSQLKFSREK